MTSPAHSGAAPAGIGVHVLRTLRLALPVIVARAGILLMTTVDTVMSGRAGTAEIAFYGIANATQIMLMLIGVGLLQGTTILTAQAFGARAFAECGTYWRLGLIHAALLGGVLGCLMLGGEAFFAATGQSEEMVQGGGAVMRAFSWGLPAVLLFVATSFFLEAINRPIPGMVVMLAANLVNIGLNWIFIHGHWGVGSMGAEGAAVATSIVRWLMAAALGAYVLTMAGHDRFGIKGKLLETWTKARDLRRLGYPIGLAYGTEAAAMTAMMMMAGLLGIVAAASYQIAMNLLALVYMITIGVGTAASVRVGNAVGRSDRPGLARAGWVASGMVTVAMVLIAVPFLVSPESLAGIFTDDSEVLAIAVPLVWIAGLALIADGPQGVLMGALRGATNVWIPSAIQLCSYWLVAVPLGYVLAFVLEWNVDGLMASLIVGFCLAGLALGVRFLVVSRRPIARYRAPPVYNSNGRSSETDAKKGLKRWPTP